MLSAPVAPAVAALGAGSRPAFLRLSLNIGTLQIPCTGCSRARSEPECHHEREQITSHASAVALVAPVGVIPIIEPATPLDVVLLAINLTGEVIQARMQLISLARRQTSVRQEELLVALD